MEVIASTILAEPDDPYDDAKGKITWTIYNGQTLATTDYKFNGRTFNICDNQSDEDVYSNYAGYPIAQYQDVVNDKDRNVYTVENL